MINCFIDKTNRNSTAVRSILVSLLILAAPALPMLRAADWPAYMHDNHRSGATGEQLELPLTQRWVYNSHQGPRPSGSETPALQNFWGGTYRHKSRVNVERAFHVVVVGDSLYFGSSSSDKVVCLSTIDGSIIWKFITGGPVRFAPAVYDGRTYFGSDDGYTYCLNAENGRLIWKYRPDFASKKMMNHNRLCSVCPVRTAILLDNGIAYWGAGLVAGAQTGLKRYIIAAEAETGKVLWTKDAPKPLQGYPLASAQNLYIPAGKSTPACFRKSDGTYLGDFSQNNVRQGGAYALLSDDNKLYFGPHYSGGGSYIGKYDAQSKVKETIAWGPGNHLVVTPSHAYYSSDTTISRIHRGVNEVAWTVSSDYPYELILAKDVLFAGGDDKVAAISTSNGDILWSEAVEGRVRGLAVADGRLFVSTDTGAIHCFKAAAKSDSNR